MTNRFPTADERWPRRGIVSKMGKRIKPSEGNKTFCMAPWVHTFISPHMERRMCCASLEQSTNFKQYIDSSGPDNNKLQLVQLKEHWNSEYMKGIKHLQWPYYVFPMEPCPPSCAISLNAIHHSLNRL